MAMVPSAVVILPLLSLLLIHLTASTTLRPVLPEEGADAVGGTIPIGDAPVKNSSDVESNSNENKKDSNEYDTIKSDDANFNQKNETITEEKVLYNGAKLFRINDVDNELKDKLEELEESGELEIWSLRTLVQDVMVKSDKIEQVSNLLDSKNATYEVLIEDMQRAIEDANPDPSPDQVRDKPKSEWRRDVWVKPATYVYYKVKLRKNQRNNSHYHYYYNNYYNNNSNKSSIINNRNDKAYNLTWQRYHRYSDYLQYMDYLQKHYSDMVSVEEVGNSVEGRPIKVIKISSGKPDAKAIWIDGGTHAREWITPAATSYIIKELVEYRAAHASSISNIDFYVAPVLNPDGYEYSHTVDRLWRKNRNRANGYCAGTDLNRNWGYRWGGAGSSKQPCKEIYAGSKAFSEPETRAISNFVLSKKDQLKAYITFHSYGQYILYPWGYASKVPPDYADLDKVGRKMALAIQKAGGPAYTVGNSASTLYAASGGADDWAKGAAGIKYTYTIELRDNGRYGFVLPAQFIEPTGKEALAAIKVVAEEVNNLT